MGRSSKCEIISFLLLVLDRDFGNSIFTAIFQLKRQFQSLIQFDAGGINFLCKHSNQSELKANIDEN